MNYIPKVSIIVPSLNSIAYIKECIDSILNQTLKDIEILCIDANSTDGTLELLKDYEKQDKRLKVIISDKKSYGYQMNLGIKEAKGEYLGIVESDDYIKENMYERLYEVAKAQDLEVVKSDYYVVKDGEKIYNNVVNLVCKDLYNSVTNWQKDFRIFLATDGINPIGIYRLDLLRTNQIKLNESLGASYQDNGLWFQIFSFAKSIYFLNEAFYMLRRDNPNSSIYSKEKVYAICEEYDYIRNFLRKYPFIEKSIAPICALHRYGNYIFTLNRIDDKYKLDFIKRFAKDFKEILENKEIDHRIFSLHKIEVINYIIENPKMFHYGLINLKSRFKNHLVYKIGDCYFKANTFTKRLKFPFSLLKICLWHNFEQKIYKGFISFRPDLKLPSLSLYNEFLDLIKIRDEATYQIGRTIFKSLKQWYKGKLFILPFVLYKNSTKNNKKENIGGGI
ncbi:glycosyltransferase family 2 protein [Campylobacter novaezeelandiae]|uniref:glycosyltransferase family 2 protein n=1 Tax=Campylobacter novaezeelandiae TaxID=2267891 RepID=UPI001905EB9F|nr:glycosyltransferase family 2 protein [Campylobacter novaezeelandiae]MBK1963774.1 glycosyltransferase family 2 protein [Campylobacter novaezeelandiae]MBK1993150.1 glycosyltransferase family 2 protein [Campylobacter novaezeelandiae]